MSNPLFDLFMIFKSAKIIWTKLEAKYGSDDAGKSNYVFGKWLQFHIVDDKPIMEQVHVYENLCAEQRHEDVRNPTGKRLDREISAFLKRLRKLSETQEERSDSSGTDHSHEE